MQSWQLPLWRGRVASLSLDLAETELPQCHPRRLLGTRFRFVPESFLMWNCQTAEHRCLLLALTGFFSQADVQGQCHLKTAQIFQIQEGFDGHQEMVADSQLCSIPAKCLLLLAVSPGHVLMVHLLSWWPSLPFLSFFLLFGLS